MEKEIDYKKLKIHEIYKRIRKNTGLSLADVSEETGIDRNTLSRFENDEDLPIPDDIVALSRCYKNKRICHWYCSTLCPVGEEIALLDINPLQSEDFAQTMMTIHSSIRELKKINLDELIDIAKDGKIDEAEKETYISIKEALCDLAKAYGSLLRIEEDDIEGTIIYRE